MRGTNVVGLLLAFFLCLAVCVNGALQEMDRSYKAEKYNKVEATVIGYSTNRDDSHYSYSSGRRYRPFIITYNCELQYFVDEEPYYHDLLHSENIEPQKNTKRTLYVNPNNPKDVMDSGAVWKEVGTFAFAGVAIVWAAFQIYMGTKLKESSADERSGYFILMIGLLAALSVIPLICIFGLSDLMVILALIGICVMGWGIKDLKSQTKGRGYTSYRI